MKVKLKCSLQYVSKKWTLFNIKILVTDFRLQFIKTLIKEFLRIVLNFYIIKTFNEHC